MGEPRGRGETRIPRNLVLLLASTMVCIGLVAGVVAWMETSGPEVPPDQLARQIDTDTRPPEVTAESFLDAWRKRDHDLAAALSTGRAAEAVEARRARDEALSDEERAIKEQLWDSMAAESLRLRVTRTSYAAEARFRLEGTAEGRFLGEPYRRDVEFALVQLGDRWFVEDMTLGDILDDPQLGPPAAKREDPSGFKMRGEEVP